MSEKEYNECVNKYADNVYRFIFKNLKHRADAEDIVQASFEALWEIREQVNIEKEKSLLFTIAYRKMIDHIRRNKKVLRQESMLAFDEGYKTNNNDLKEVLNRALYTLDETKRSLVLLKDYEGYSYQEIGEITGFTESQVKVYLHRARLQLRSYLVKIENII